MSHAFTLDVPDDKVGILTFDLPGKGVNTLGQAVLMELAGVIGQLATRTDLRGLLVRSGKAGQFIAGADLKELGALAFATKEQVAQAIGFGHKLFAQLGGLPFPTVALVDGNCMGGGTELILALDDRIVSAAPQTKIALPETKLGLLPAWGGTQRLPRLIGLNAIDVICSGEPVDASKAVAIGLAFDAVPADQLIEAGRRRIESLHEHDEWKARRERASAPVGLGPDAMQFAFAVAEGAIKAKTKGQYPAPLVALKAIRDGLNLPLDEALKVERQAGMELVGTPTSANLIGVFFMKNRLDRDPGVADASITPREVRRVGVLGTGTMGAGIAAAHARSGIPTAMVDVDDGRLAAGMAKAQDVVMSRIKIGRATPQDLGKMLALLSTSTTSSVFADRDVVIEAVTEDEAVKTAMFRQLAGVLPEGAILASNTSTISITRMAESAPDPSRFAGMHFFHPVDRMELVEVIRGERTSDETVATLVALARRIRKTPIVVRDCAGFLVNRVLFPYMNEALLMVQEGMPMAAIDSVAMMFGMPMGPIALADLVGLDTTAYAGKVLATAYPDRAVATPILWDLVKAGRLGVKSGAGFRKYTARGGKAEADPALAPILAKHGGDRRVVNADAVTDRLFLPMLLEATRVLEEGIVREPADVDMGLIFGIGFPPYKGGILRWADSEGVGKIVERLEQYRALGKRFEPTEMLMRMAKSGETFYPRPKVVSQSA